MLSEKSPPPENASQRIHLPLLIGSKPFPDDGLPLYTDSRVGARVPSPWKRGFFVISSLCLLLVLVRSLPLSGLPSTRPPLLVPEASQAVHTSNAIGRNPARLIIADHGAVAAENERCSKIGVDVLKEGGNAVDAAISASFCTGVVNMFS
jgi:gamma-glutamyltranspeptidase/glutathione hydrolase/leukotriene-C4 hydrolase